MRNSSWVTTAICATLVFTATGARSADITIRKPDVPATKAAAELTDRAARAITAYLTSCAARDAQGVSDVTTDDVRIEYMLKEPGLSIAVDGNSLFASCSGALASTSHAPIADLWIFPTPDASAVFIHYDAGKNAHPVHRQLALVEMRGDRISRMVNYAGAPAALLAKIVNDVSSVAQASHAPPRQVTERAK